MGRRTKGYIVNTQVVSSKTYAQRFDFGALLGWGEWFAGTLGGTNRAKEIASDALSFVWEGIAAGELTIEDQASYKAAMSEEIYKGINRARREARWNKNKSLDANLRDDDTRETYESGFMGRTPPNQIPYTYLHEIKRDVQRLPNKYRRVIEGLMAGQNALDISKTERIPVHIVFANIKTARRMMFDLGLWDGKDWK